MVASHQAGQVEGLGRRVHGHGAVSGILTHGLGWNMFVSFQDQVRPDFIGNHKNIVLFVKLHRLFNLPALPHAAARVVRRTEHGCVWERWEIEKAMELYKKYDVFVISDEIWSDLILEGHKHIPTQSVSEDARNRTVAMYAPSKTFNLAGLVGSYHIIYNTWLRERVLKESSLSHYNAMNVLSMHALVGAYKPEGYEWLDELRQVLTGNVEFACRYIQDHFEGIEVSKPEGTYMLFLDCTKWCEKHGKTIDELQRAGVEVGVIWQDGRPFHGPCHIRMNLALPFSRVQEAFERLDRYVFHAK